MTSKEMTFPFDGSDGFDLAIILASMNSALHMALAEYCQEHGKKPYAAVFDLYIPLPMENICLEEVKNFGVIGMGKRVEKNGFHPLRAVFAYIGEKDECDAFNDRMNKIIKAEYPSFGCEYMEIPL